MSERNAVEIHLRDAVRMARNPDEAKDLSLALMRVWIRTCLDQGIKPSKVQSSVDQTIAELYPQHPRAGINDDN